MEGANGRSVQIGHLGHVDGQPALVHALRLVTSGSHITHVVPSPL
jgi:hypothetical protein